MKKTNDHNTDINAVPKNDSRPSWANIACMLRDWADRESSILVAEFYTNVGLSCKTFYRAVNSNSDMKEANEYALRKLGIRRHKIVYDERLSNNLHITWSLRQYIQEIKDEIRDEKEFDKKLAIEVAKAVEEIRNKSGNTPAVINFYEKGYTKNDDKQ